MKSAYRLAALDARALALGLKPMAALADARAMYPSLAVHDCDPDGDRGARDALVDWCRRFTPLAAPDGEDGAMLDISGAAHLFGGEAALRNELRERLALQGFASAVAIADTPGAAWALARYGGCKLIENGLTPEQRAKIFASMPLAALRLGDRVIAQLGQAGLRRVGDLLLRPRAPIAARFGRDIHDRLDELLGRATRPISPRFEAPPFLAERRFAEGIARREDVEATILALAYDLCGLLARHGEGARRLDVALYRVDGVVKHLEAGTSRPLRDPVVMARLFRERIEAAGEDGLETGYGFDMVRLAALSAERLDAFAPSWAEAEGGAAELAELVDRLGARFGLARVTRLALADSHQPERAAVAHPPLREARGRGTTRRVVEGAPARSNKNASDTETFRPRLSQAAASSTAFGGPPPPLRGGGSDALPERPIRLFERPEPIDTIAEVPDGPPLRFEWRRMIHHVVAIEGPERIAPDWWRLEESGATRDYFRAEDTDGRRFWLYREGLYRAAAEPRWFLHGLFA